MNESEIVFRSRKNIIGCHGSCHAQWLKIFKEREIYATYFLQKLRFFGMEGAYRK